MNNLLESEFSLIKIDESKLHDISYVSYLESLDFYNFEKNGVSIISDAYMKLLKKSEKILRKKLPSLGIYDYKSSVIETIAPIQPHDSQINIIKNNGNDIEISGNGVSFKNYEHYDFKLNFNNTNNIRMEKITYEKGELISMVPLTEQDLDLLSSYFYRNVFFDETNTLKKEITMIFINRNDEEELTYSEAYEGRRELLIINFDFNNVSLTMSYQENIKKLKY